MAFSVVMLFVLWSVRNSGVNGTRDWFRANVLAVAGLLCFAGRGVLPDFVSIEAANLLYLCAIGMMLAGFRRHAGKAVPTQWLGGGAALAMGVILAFHYGVELGAPRVIAVSIFHGCVCFAIGTTVRTMAGASQPRYPFLFTSCAGFAFAAAHAVRLLYHALLADMAVQAFAPTVWNTMFFAFGTLTFPVLTLGAVMMANARILAKAAYEADHDHLTGAWSRRAFFKLAEREHARTLRNHSELSLLVFDVDHFKAINDTFGHAVGDEVLADIVACTQKVIRSIDLCARLGGEEFAVLLPGADAGMAQAVAERLRTALEGSLDLGPLNACVSYTVSIGIASLRPDEPLTDLMAGADKALYSAKSAGRNRAICA